VRKGFFEKTSVSKNRRTASSGSVNHLLNIFFKTGRFIAAIFESKGNHLGARKFWKHFLTVG
jgi:hypothetical protein